MMIFVVVETLLIAWKITFVPLLKSKCYWHDMYMLSLIFNALDLFNVRFCNLFLSTFFFIKAIQFFVRLNIPFASREKKGGCFNLFRYPSKYGCKTILRMCGQKYDNIRVLFHCWSPDHNDGVRSALHWLPVYNLIE